VGDEANAYALSLSFMFMFYGTQQYSLLCRVLQGDHSPDNVKFHDGLLHYSAALAC